MYHRIAEVKTDPWQLSVTPEHFEQHLSLFSKKFKVLPLRELITQLSTQSIASNSLCLTFDDGYIDNFYFAKPLLEKYGCPATFFIPSQNIIRQEMFWWDVLEDILLNTDHLPNHFSQTINGYEINVNLNDEILLTEQISKKQNAWTWPDTPPTQRCALYLQVWEQLKPLQDADIETELTKIKTWAKVKDVSKPESLPMTIEQVQSMSSNPLFQIGMHTASHPALSFHSYELQHKEILENKNILYNKCNHFTNSIAYPYGSYNDVTLNIVRELKLTAAFSTKAIAVSNESDIMNLGRFQVYNCDSDTLEKKLLSWFKGA